MRTSLLARSLALFVVWLLLTQSLDAFYLALGAVSALTIARLHTRGPSTGGMRWVGLALYAPWLLLQVLKSGLHVTYLILHPRMPIDPKVIRFKTALRHPAALTIFGNSITLTPGTITAEAGNGEVQIHAMDEDSAAGLQDMERTIVRLFGGGARPDGGQER